MAFDLVPKRLLSFPSIPTLWDDDENWLAMPSAQSGLSISEDENNVYIEAAVPGIHPDNIEVTYQDGYVWIHGEEKDEEKDKNRKYYRHSSQAFSYRVAVPGDIDPNTEPEATYKHGMMIVTFAKSPKSQPKKLKVRTVSDEAANK